MAGFSGEMPGGFYSVSHAFQRHGLGRREVGKQSLFRLVQQSHEVAAYLCKFPWCARIMLRTEMLTYHISMSCTRPLGRIDNVALKRWAPFTVE